MDVQKRLQMLPPIDVLLNTKDAVVLYTRYDRQQVKTSCQSVLDAIRGNIKDIPYMEREQWIPEIMQRVKADLVERFTMRLKPVINATGIVLHTGLGRAPFAAAARENVAHILEGYSNLELEMDTGKRGIRHQHVEHLICELTGGEAAIVVNNNAAAVFITLNTVAFGKQAMISRGQLVEIGGSFRIPDVMEKSGAMMVEVGTTNKTKLSDYRNALSDNTGAIMVAHTSNYRILGFTAQVEITELKELVRDTDIPIVHDLGGGVIVDLADYNLPYEPLVQHSLRDGADIVTFSGDKILGGPQCGIITGKKAWIDRIASNPIMRAVRCDKMTYAALEATLQLFLHRESLVAEHPVLRMLTEPAAKVKERAQRILELLDVSALGVEIKIEESKAQTGSGALPLESLPSYALVISGKVPIQTLATRLRLNETPIVGYISNEKLVLDIRTVFEDQAPLVAQILLKVLSSAQ